MNYHLQQSVSHYRGEKISAKPEQQDKFPPFQEQLSVWGWCRWRWEGCPGSLVMYLINIFMFRVNLYFQSVRPPAANIRDLLTSYRAVLCTTIVSITANIFFIKTQNPGWEITLIIIVLSVL